MTTTGQILASCITPVTVSQGTERPEDLIPAFIEELDAIREEITAPGRHDQAAEETAERVRLASLIDDACGRVEVRMRDPDYYCGDAPEDDLAALIDLLNALSPPGHRFGAFAEGDTDFGFWESGDDCCANCGGPLEKGCTGFFHCPECGEGCPHCVDI